jgi:hypothetical protein
MDPATRLSRVPAARRLAAVAILLLNALLIGGCAKLDGLRRLDPLRVLAPQGDVSGQLRVGRTADASALGPAVVFLVSSEAAAPAAPVVRTIRVRDGRPAASLAVLAPGDAVRFASADAIHHRFFARSKRGEAIEIALPPKSTSRPMRPRAAERGLRFYCQLHEDESFLLFVSPSPHYAIVDPRGRWAIADVPRGTWRMHVWSEPIAGSIREIEVDGRGANETIWLDARRLQKD